MRMMKKVLGTVTVLALSVSLLAGCGSTAASPVSSAASTAAESTTSSVVSDKDGIELFCTENLAGQYAECDVEQKRHGTFCIKII